MGGTGTDILVINAGSSSIKFAVFDKHLTQQISGQISDIGGNPQLTLGDTKRAVNAPDHATAIKEILATLSAANHSLDAFAAVAHRVVHGGENLTEACKVTKYVLAEIRACVPLAPLHNPHNLRAIEIISAQAPDLPQFANFDTAFHATNPDVATRYAVPKRWQDTHIRRFGFHGPSYQSLVTNFTATIGAPLPARLLALHLGNGASICAIQNGKSVATTMGYSPLEGLTMGTRSGSIDAGAALRIAEEIGVSDALATLNEKSGLFALSNGISDMATLLETNTPEARFAVEHFCYWAARHAGSMIAAMGGIDAVAFTGGIGENAAPIRDRIMELLNWTGIGQENAFVIPAAEERQIALNTQFSEGFPAPG